MKRTKTDQPLGDAVFPQTLDGAQVLLHTAKGDFGTMYLTTGEVYGEVRYLAICQYPEDARGHYLFQVSQDREVIGDTLCGSVEACLAAANGWHGDEVAWLTAEQRHR